MALARVQVVLFAALLLAAAALIVPSVAAPSPAHAQVRVSALESGVLQQLNTIRAQHGLQPVKLNAGLSAAAVEHTREMGADGYFRHESFDGSAFWKRVRHWYDASGHSYWAIGENLLWSSPDVTAAEALQLWMRSPEHRANILKAEWREIGVSALHFNDAPGTYGGKPVTIVTTDFGVRR
jgi:uncharacterized protein YkwD